MPIHENGPARIHHEEAGSGFPKLFRQVRQRRAILADHAFGEAEQAPTQRRVPPDHRLRQAAKQFSRRWLRQEGLAEQRAGRRRLLALEIMPAKLDQRLHQVG
jgi:hypothetical protein